MKIFLELTNKNVFAFQVLNNEKILKLKNEINTLFGSILQNYVLIYDDRILNDDKTWDEYKIEEKSLINADRCENRIFVESTNEMLLGLELGNLRVFELMKKVQEKIGIAEGDQILIYDNALLEDGGKVLREFGISGNSVIRVLDRSRGEMLIFIKIMDGRKFVMEVQKSDKIIDLKYKIQGKVGSHPDEQILICKVEMFDEYKTIDEYQICDQSVINVICQFRCSGMQLFAKTMDGKQVTLEAQKSDKIINIKYEIKYKIGLSPDKQILIYQDEILNDDNKTIDEYQIVDGDMINVVENLRDVMVIFTRTEDGKIDLITVQKSDKIIDIKYQIQEKTRLLPAFQKLKNRGRILEDDKTIDEYKICEKDVINVVLQLRGGGMTIFGRTIDGETFSLDVEKSYKIRDLKYKFIDKTKLSKNEQILIYQGKILNDDDKTIDEYQISDQSIIHIVSKLKDEMNIFAVTIDGNLFPLNVEKSNKIIDIKYKIQNKIGLHRDEQILFVGDQILENDYKTIEEYLILDLSVIKVVAGWKGGGIGIFVKVIDGESVAFEVQHSDKIIVIKRKIQEKLGLLRNEQILIYQDEILKDDKRVDFYSIFDNSVINVVVRLRDGMQIFAKTMDDSLVPLTVQISDRIIDIKQQIQEKTGLYPDEQELIYQGEILKDEYKRIDEYEICEKYMINIIARWRSGGIGIFVKVIGRKTITIEVKLYEQIADIKNKIQDKTGLNSNEQKLIYQGEILKDGKTIDQYQIYDQSLINVVGRLSNKILIFAEIINGEILTFTMPINSTISDVKNQINKKLKLTINDEILIYHDNMSHDNDYSKLINQYQSNMIFTLTIRSKYEKSFTIDLSKHENIKEIKKSIKSKLKINENYEKIIFNNKQLLTNDDQVIYSYEIVPRSIIDLDCALREFRLFIQSIKSGSFDDVQKYFQKEFLEKKHGSYLRYPIHYAVRYGHLEIINYLINQQCNIESVDFENIRPIHYACYYGTGEILKLFIENKCDLELSDLLKRRPIHFACHYGNFEIINLLIENRCELEIKDMMKRTPLKIVRKKNYFQSSKIIEEEIEKIKMDKIAIRMNLKCTNECDHKNCCTSFFRSILYKKFDKDERIGKGNFGKVYKCQEPFTGAKFAVKIIDKNKKLSKYIENNINNFTEILIHPRIIQYFGAVEKEKKMFIFIELLSENSLEMKIKSSLSPQKVIHYTKQMLEALKFLHERKIIHRDIKPENSLLKDDDNLKLIDFGLSLKLTQTDGITEKAATFCGTREYIAPEIISNGLYTCSVDIWSLGVSVVYMATGKLPSFDFWSNRKQEYKLPDSLPHFKDLIDGMLIQDPKKRLSAEQLLEMFEYYSSNDRNYSLKRQCVIS